MKNFYITSCEKSFNSFDFYVKEGTKTLEGERTKIQYYLQEGSPQPSFLQIRRNYGNAVKNIGGIVLYDDDRRGTFKVTKGGKETWIALEAFNEDVLPASLYSGKKFAGGEAGRQTFPSPPGCGAVGSV
jgi:hypothetical protein